MQPMLSSHDRMHDPGIAPAKARADAQMAQASGPARLKRPTSDVLIGTAGWTDPTLVAPGVFYPSGASSPEARLRYYTTRFPLVEVDSTYYALPAPRMAELWVERTPADFVFNVKAFSLLTGHAAETNRFPKTLREALPPDIAGRRRVYAKDLPAEIRNEVWRLFAEALQPLGGAGKLGAVLMQYPRWVRPGPHTARMFARLREHLRELPVAVEFRHPEWLSPAYRERTLALLRDHDMSYVMVDEPQGLQSSVPPLVAVTTPRLAVVRMHGRRGETWEKPGATVIEKFRYLYDSAELTEWVPRIEQAAEAARQVHVVFNNCYGNYGTTNALEMRSLLR